MENTFFDEENVSVMHNAPLTDRVNAAPSILRGLSGTETVIALSVFFPFFLIIGVIISSITGKWMIAPLAGFIGSFTAVWFGAGYIAGIKRNRPDHYYNQAAAIWLDKIGGPKSKFIRYSGNWEIGRTFITASSSKSKKRPKPTASKQSTTETKIEGQTSE
jgi:conjugative transfer region protein (TIGR03750 family)